MQRTFIKFFFTERNRNYLKRLEDRGVPRDAIRDLQKQEERVAEEAANLFYLKYAEETIDTLRGRGIYLALPVIPQAIMGIAELTAMVRVGSKSCSVPHYTELVSEGKSRVVDTEEAPIVPYYMFDVDDGRDSLGGTPYGYGARVGNDGLNRRCHTAAEALALCVHTSVLLHHELWVCGSYCGGEQQFLHIGFNADQNPVLMMMQTENRALHSAAIGRRLPRWKSKKTGRVILCKWNLNLNSNCEARHESRYETEDGWFCEIFRSRFYYRRRRLRVRWRHRNARDQRGRVGGGLRRSRGCFGLIKEKAINRRFPLDKIALPLAGYFLIKSVRQLLSLCFFMNCCMVCNRFSFLLEEIAHDRE